MINQDIVSVLFRVESTSTFPPWPFQVSARLIGNLTKWWHTSLPPHSSFQFLALPIQVSPSYPPPESLGEHHTSVFLFPFAYYPHNLYKYIHS